MFDKHSIETFKKNNKPKWSKPFLHEHLAVATWNINGKLYHEMVSTLGLGTIHGWTYEGN